MVQIHHVLTKCHRCLHRLVGQEKPCWLSHLALRLVTNQGMIMMVETFPFQKKDLTMMVGMAKAKGEVNETY